MHDFIRFEPVRGEADEHTVQAKLDTRKPKAESGKANAELKAIGDLVTKRRESVL